MNSKNLMVRSAAEILKNGGIVVYPTDTLYGLGCNALDEAAIRRVFEIKRRPFSKPLPIAVADFEMMKKYAFVNKTAEKVATKFLPGALTLVLKKKNLPDLLTSNLPNVAIRIPNNKIALKLIKLAGVPITATSANISEATPPISVDEVSKQIKDVDAILDAGKLHSRIPSTILDLTASKPKILREGKIKKDKIEKIMEH